MAELKRSAKKMAHFEDLSSYQYAGRHHPGVVHVGWLGAGQPYSRGAVSPTIVEKMKRLAEVPVELYRGYHVCELCEMPEELRGRPFPEQWEKWAQFRKSNGEIRLSRDGVTYAAPVLITHYIDAHGYRPPTEFLRAVEEERLTRHQSQCPGWRPAMAHLRRSAKICS